jgi:uncharacterized membrane protein YuzA (DUF378 family)
MKMATWVLLLVGGINWLLVGLFSTDVGTLLFGSMDHIVSKVIYVLVGLSALYQLFMMKSSKSDMMKPMMMGQ